MNILYEILTSPLGLPISPVWEYVILFVVGEIVHEIAWNVSPGGRFGSLIYWVTKLIVFVLIWAVLYGIIKAVQFVIAHWVWFAIGAGLLLVGTIVFIVLNNRKTSA